MCPLGPLSLRNLERHAGYADILDVVSEGNTFIRHIYLYEVK